MVMEKKGLTFGSEVEVLSDTSGLVVSTKHPKALWKVYLIGKKKKNDFDREITSIYIVTQKQILSTIYWSCSLHQILKIVKLAMNVSKYCAK
jgi:hypothetical protein